MRTDLQKVLDRIRARSRDSRAAYLERMDAQRRRGPHRGALSCGNLAHGFAACGAGDKAALMGEVSANLGIVTAYNDMLSAHQPLKDYPDLIKEAARQVGATAQVAGAVPAMCDGVTQGQPGMDLSLASRDVIALSTAIALSHNMFDGAVLLGTCDKIVPGLFIGALAFGHLPMAFLPAGPMPSGLPNKEKAQVRQDYAAGKIGKDKLMAAESASYHAPGTCTFYGTANSNQMVLEFMGLQLPGTTFVPPYTEHRRAVVSETAQQVLRRTDLGEDYGCLAEVVNEAAVLNALVGLMATGGSTNLILHMVPMAAAAGVQIRLEDFADISEAVPLLARVYPNGPADVNHMDAAGGLPFLIKHLRDEGYLSQEVKTLMGEGLEAFGQSSSYDGKLTTKAAKDASSDEEVLRTPADPFAPTGGLKMLSGNLGQGVIKVSAVDPKHHRVSAPAKVFESQEAFLKAFEAGDLHCDHVAVLRFQGPQSNGMPELHKLTPPLGVLQGLGYAVALVTDGRMSGASGKVPAAIHLSPEARVGGPLAKVRDGDLITLDAQAGTLKVEADLDAREAVEKTDRSDESLMGRELFAGVRSLMTTADQGGSFVL